MEALTRDELLRLLKVAKQKRERDWLMFLVGYWHGLRATEVISLTPANFDGGYLTVQRLKGSKKTTQPLMSHSDPLLDEKTALGNYLGQFSNDAGVRLFPISRKEFWHLMQVHGAKADIPGHKRHPHVLKHSVAIHMIREAGIENVKQYLGHKSGASTMEYLKASDEDAAAAVARAEQQRMDSRGSQLDTSERLSVGETLRRALRMIEQAETKKQAKRAR